MSVTFSGGVNFAIEDASVSGHSEEVLELGGFDELADEEGGVLIGLVAFGWHGVFGAGEFGVDVFVAECSGDGPTCVGAVGEFGTVVHPLPELRARDFSSSGVFHEVEQRNAADAAQPGFDVAEA